jgi:hypothetical protein
LREGGKGPAGPALFASSAGQLSRIQSAARAFVSSGPRRETAMNWKILLALALASFGLTACTGRYYGDGYYGDGYYGDGYYSRGYYSDGYYGHRGYYRDRNDYRNRYDRDRYDRGDYDRDDYDRR